MDTTSDLDVLGFLVADSARLLRAAFERRIAQAGLGITPGEARALINIAAIDGGRQSELAARMGVEPMTICAYLDKLQSLGLIERQQCSSDRRAKRVRLAATSGEMLDAIRSELRALLTLATEGINEGQCLALQETLKTFNANLQAATPSASSPRAFHEN